MPTNPRVFYIGLNMAGAVSAGAYTAGVMDFLIDALDTLYEKRAEQTAKYGSDFAKWEIPAHEVRLAVMSGASAGGMTSAISAVSLCETFTPVRSPMPSSAPNALYRSWVENIDLSYLLQSNDLEDPKAAVVSLLDSTQINRIAEDAIQIRNPNATKRAWLADPLRLVLTLTNLGGIPYAIEADAGNAETQTLYHADQANFEVRWDHAAGETSGLILTPHSGGNWPALAEAAKATGAFPVALAPRQLTRTAGMYNNRRWRLSQPSPQVANSSYSCEYFDKMTPNWPYGDDVVFKTLNVDGGVTNNDPFECAHQVLLDLDPKPESGRNPRSGQHADRAVVSIAPFLSTPQFDIDKPPKPELTSVFGALLDSLINQSRIQGENIKLTHDPTVFSRWAISPSIDDTTRNALASAALGAFGGFIAKEFRDHDYQLGRRNCQWFLKQHFGVPLDNVVVQSYGQQQSFPGFGMTLPDGSQGIALIPLLGSLDPTTNPIPEVHVKIPREHLQPIVNAAATRAKVVARQMMSGAQGMSLLKNLGFNAAWMLVDGRLKRAIADKLGYELGREDLVS